MLSCYRRLSQALPPACGRATLARTTFQQLDRVDLLSRLDKLCRKLELIIELTQVIHKLACPAAAHHTVDRRHCYR
ncbi:hypothetical protein V6N12_076169 [Hibiscus sabdariffa]|uniref:Uncharacterized protein n=1 Tax=Hibiscus sabdariffa TaxID=183260 RepID=A0ABR2AW76_9ROSI